MEKSTCTCRHKYVDLSDPFPEMGAKGAFADYINLSFGSYKMKLKRELCASRRKLSQQAGWTIASDAGCLYGIVLL